MMLNSFICPSRWSQSHILYKRLPLLIESAETNLVSDVWKHSTLLQRLPEAFESTGQLQLTRQSLSHVSMTISRRIHFNTCNKILFKICSAENVLEYDFQIVCFSKQIQLTLTFTNCTFEHKTCEGPIEIVDFICR